jgi:hypothetical protein
VSDPQGQDCFVRKLLAPELCGYPRGPQSLGVSGHPFQEKPRVPFPAALGSVAAAVFQIAVDVLLGLDHIEPSFRQLRKHQQPTGLSGDPQQLSGVTLRQPPLRKRLPDPRTVLQKPKLVGNCGLGPP